MPLVDYSDSESSDSPSLKDTAAVISRKRKREGPSASDLPPLPESFHDLYATNTRASTQDDPSLHGGRHRQTPHVEGNWPTHVYIEWYPTKEGTSQITHLLSSVRRHEESEKQHVHSLLESDLGTALPLHISLSRSIALTTEQRRPFLDKMEQHLASARINPFNLNIKGTQWVPNYERNRWFLVLQVEKPDNDGLNKLLHISNAAAEFFALPTLYTEPRKAVVQVPVQKKRKFQQHRGNSSNMAAVAEVNNRVDLSSCFHISVAWILDQPTDGMLKTLDDLVVSRNVSLGLKVSTVKAKVGNVVTSWPLAAKLETNSGII